MAIPPYFRESPSEAHVTRVIFSGILLLDDTSNGGKKLQVVSHSHAGYEHLPLQSVFSAYVATLLIYLKTASHHFSSFITHDENLIKYHSLSIK